MRLYNTLSDAVEPLEPSPLVRMYVCGVTPYDSAHLGHAATFLTYDLLARRLEDMGRAVKLVRNVTDVDDSILARARELDVPYLTLAAAEIERLHSDMAAIDVRPPDEEPRATEAIDDMVALIQVLLDKGHGYRLDGWIYFDVRSYRPFGSLARYDPDLMLRLARSRGGDPDRPGKRDPLDFVLWQPSAPDEPSWDTAIGPGRPGWHIECSAMSLRSLGSAFEVHGGGTDVIFPHHECERTQSEAATGQPAARHWVHAAVVSMAGEKMSKSLGNIVFVKDLRRTCDPRAIRLALLSHHYRAGFEWRPGEVDMASRRLERLLAAARGAGGTDPRPYADRVRQALDDDLDAPVALAVLEELAGSVLAGGGDERAPAQVRALASLLGLDLAEPLGAR